LATGTAAASPSDHGIRVVSGGRVHTIAEVEPTLTVLRYLREVARRTGTKEGCAEGDCGACTVVLGELDGDRVRYRAVNACILFLPALDGKQLITVEDLKGADGALHPAQQALVDCHGSQCGFCTPGFVMSLFALYKSGETPSRAVIDDTLAGNLCRCTGYRTIVAAAEKMYQPDVSDQFSVSEAETVGLLRSIRRDDTLALEHEGRRYFAPASLDDLADLAAKHPKARLLAGGTDLGLEVTKQHRDLDTVIAIGAVPELRAIEIGESHIEIGAAVTYSDAFQIIAEHYPDFGELLRRLGSVQIRNAGTLGGNIGNASPIGDTLPALIALGASVVLRRGANRREFALDDFFVGYRQTALQPGEFIAGIRVPLAADGHAFYAYKVSKRFDQDISGVLGAFSLHLDGGRVRHIRICFGGMAATPKRASRCEAALEGRDWSEATLAAAMGAIDEDYDPLDDFRASAAYRKSVARNLLRKLYLETTASGGGTRVAGYGG
jgi:xanthine dehydrogenase small subunit